MTRRNGTKKKTAPPAKKKVAAPGMITGHEAHQRRLAKVRNVFDAAELIRICELPQSEFGEFGTIEDLGYSYGGRKAFYYHADHGSKILAVAHLDSVQDNPKAHVVYTPAGPVVHSGALDDRLGCYIILNMLGRLGIKTDILLTTNEEVGATTASEFFTEKDYNWMIEFDRMGTDVVMYDYETAEYAAMVERSGAKVGIGSYSDISALQHLGCAGFNWGCGYQQYHTKRSHAFLEDTFAMVARFMRFHELFSDIYLEHDERTVDKYRNTYCRECNDVGCAECDLHLFMERERRLGNTGTGSAG